MTAPTAGLDVLSTEECLELLAAHCFGRVAFAAAGVPLILPVNYVFQEPDIVVLTAPGTKLTDIPLTIVAFEIDAADPDGGWGWSVVVQGPAFDITDSPDEHSSALRRLPVEPWAPGDRRHWLRITAATVQGRRFGRMAA